MTINKTLITVTTAFITVFTGSASAHALGAPGAGFVEGLAHPFMGLDHALAMLSVGLWAAQLGGRAYWLTPLAFVTVLAGGAGLALLGWELPLVETMIAASVILLGLLLAGAVRVAGWASVLAVSLFALFHGYAHGLEMPQTAMPWAYASGFTLATALLQGLGIGLGLILHRGSHLPRIGGAAIALTGAYLLAGM